MGTTSWKDSGKRRGKGGKSGKGGQTKGGGQCKMGGGGSGAGGCFVKDTLITTADGFKAIDAIQVGDDVLTINEQTGVQEYKKVVRLFQLQAEELMELTVEDAIIKVTPKHRFYVKGKGWTEARNTQRGDSLENSLGKSPLLLSDARSLFFDEPLTVYNMEVEGNHNYFVSKGSILAHNLKEAGGGLLSPTTACFVGTTLIQTRDGLKEIKEIEVGDEVKTVNTESWTVEYQPVVRKYGAQTNSYYQIKIGQESVFSTENHRYRVLDRGWVKACELKAGDKVFAEKGLEIVNSIILLTAQKQVAVYNIEVKSNDNYLVGQDGFLVVDRWVSNTMECLQE